MVFSLMQGLRYASFLTDMLPFYRYLCFVPPALLTIAFGLVLDLMQVAFVAALSLMLTLPFVHRFHVWRKSYHLKSYSDFLENLKQSSLVAGAFNQYDELSSRPGTTSVFIRHDVDISLSRALKMAELEQAAGIPSTYFFRMHAEKYTFEEAVPVISQLHNSGFEIGLHYDTLSHTRGNREEALHLFREDLARLRQIAPVQHVCAHGHRRFKNQSMWKEIGQKKLGIRSVYEMHSDIYISDAGGKSLIDSQGRHALEKVNDAVPDQVVQVLVHPDWWF